MSDSSDVFTFTIIVLGGRGSGKTTYLASMFSKLGTQGDLGFFLHAKDPGVRQTLNQAYNKMIDPFDDWPPGTGMEVIEGNFVCRVQSGPTSFPACEFKYYDYAGGRLTDTGEVVATGGAALEKAMQTADSLLGILDGEKILNFIERCQDPKREESARKWINIDLRNILQQIQGRENGRLPVHFVITKWDLIQDRYSLDSVRDELLGIPDFKNLFNSLKKAHSSMRLIPVSSVGKGFATLESGVMKKNPDVIPTPFQVEMPLACVVIDALKLRIEELERKGPSQKPIVVDPNLSWLDKLCVAIVSLLDAAIEDFLPKKYQKIATVLHDLAKTISAGAKNKLKSAAEREVLLREEQARTLRAVKDEQTALKHATTCFVAIQQRLDARFPASMLS